MIVYKFKRFVIYTGIAVAASAVTLLTVRARAGGIPDADALTYTGYLEGANGAALIGPVAVAIELWDDPKAGKKRCEQANDSVTLQSGRFQLALPKECTDAVAAFPNLWADVKIDGASLGRTKLGAVPYAIEAAHAAASEESVHTVSADSAGTAGALTAKAVLGVPVRKAVAAGTETTEKLTLPDDGNGTFLLTASLSGPGSDVHNTYVVHTPLTALNVHAQLLSADAFGLNYKIAVTTQDGAPGWYFNPSGGRTLNLVFTTGGQAATATYTLVRVQ